jgi:glucose/arabinose dehydrogenase
MTRLSIKEKPMPQRLLRRRRLPAVLLTLAVLCTVPALRAAQYQLETLAEDLHHPWSVAFLPDGEYLVTLRSGELLRLEADGSSRVSLDGVPATYFAGQGGFFDVALDPAFTQNRQIYLSYAHGTPGSNTLAVMRATLGASALQDGEVILLAEPTRATPQHYGGRLLFLPDGTLLVATGEGFEYREAAQDIDQHLGKVLRINSDGSAPDDNPFADRGGPAAKVWTLGHRNTQGLVYDREAGVVYQHEHGPRGGDELNLLTVGNNYGWPAATHGVNYSGAYVSPFTELPGMRQPLHYWVPGIAPSGLAIYRGEAFPAWRGSLFVGALVDRDVHRVEIEQGEIVAEERLFGELGERIRDVRTDPQGELYLVTDGPAGKIIRVRPLRRD